MGDRTRGGRGARAPDGHLTVVIQKTLTLKIHPSFTPNPVSPSTTIRHPMRKGNKSLQRS